jgi:hypothetical protein
MAGSTLPLSRLAPLVAQLGLYSAAEERVTTALSGLRPLDAPVTYVRDARNGDLWVVLEQVRVGRVGGEVPALVRFPSKERSLAEVARLLRPENKLLIVKEVISTETLAAWFLNRTQGVEDVWQRERSTWAPASSFSRGAVRALAGDLPASESPSGDAVNPEILYYWYDLARVEPKRLIWRMSGNGTLWVFIRQVMGWEYHCYPCAQWARLDDGRSWRDLLVEAGVLPMYR